jgi:hypothetical protein
MQWKIPLPFGEIRIRIRRTRQPRAFFWYTLLSILLHVVFVSLVAGAILRAYVSVKQPQQEPVMVSISSAMRIEPRARPVPANHPMERPQPQPKPVPQQQQPQPQQQQRPRPELSKPARVAYVQPKEQTQRTLTAAQIDAQTRAFSRTIAQARAASDPVAGAANSNLAPAAPKRYRLNIQGDYGPAQPEGVLTPLRRWIDGPYVYYYVRYDVEYADGTTETGNVPWPIRFPVDEDPFARGIRRMPLPGPLPGYVLPAGVALDPLAKNCYDHHYYQCPIAHE